jgi:hypothetical protein
MAEFSETEFKLKRKDVISMYERITQFLMNDFESKFKSHSEQNHKWFVQGTIHGIARALTIDKQVAIYLILGSNPRRQAWGNLKEKYNVEPAKYVLRREVVTKGKTLSKEHIYKVFFTDVKGNGDFHMKVVYYKIGEEEPKKEAYVPRMKTSFVKKSDSKVSEETSESQKPETTKSLRLYAEAALRGKDKPAPKPMEDPKNKPKASIALLAEESSDEDSIEEHSSVSSKN